MPLIVRVRIPDAGSDSFPPSTRISNGLTYNPKVVVFVAMPSDTVSDMEISPALEKVCVTMELFSDGVPSPKFHSYVRSFPSGSNDDEMSRGS